jgi:hypothetical protein
VTSRQVLRLLAQVARALEATHAAEGTHRDVKGHNVRVRPDGHAVLVNFGSCHYRGAPTLTRHPPPPGTSQYYCPESLRFQWEHHRDPTTLERAAQTARSEADQPITPRSSLPDSRKSAYFLRSSSKPSAWPWPIVTVGVCLSLMVWWAGPATWRHLLPIAAQPKQDERTVGLSDTAPEVSATEPSLVPVQRSIGRNMPKEPFPGQRLPPCAKDETPINGGCWGQSPGGSPPCGERSVEWKNKCYWPV